MQTKNEQVLKAFSELWANLFSTPIHLDSALSKQPSNLKSILAQIVPDILLRPVSLAEALGVGLTPGVPWCLENKDLEQWRPALLMVGRMYGMMVQGKLNLKSLPDDFPPEMISEWTQTWGPSVTQELVQCLSREAPLSLRVKCQVGNQAVFKRLTSGKKLPVRAELSPMTPFGIRFSGYLPILDTDSYREGDFEIQDEGSQWMALFTLWPEIYGSYLQKTPGKVNFSKPVPEAPKKAPAWTVVDACAGAGGKTLALADLLRGKGRIFAYDRSKIKLQALKRRATRAQLTNIQSVCLTEGSELDVIDQFKESAHVVLVDAPCSGWGVLRRNPDIKWRQSEETLTRMPEVQLRLLSLYSSLVEIGGRLVYGVCTFRKSETTDVIESFLQNHSGFELNEGGYLGPDPCDGFFMQALTRVK